MFNFSNVQYEGSECKSAQVGVEPTTKRICIRYSATELTGLTTSGLIYMLLFSSATHFLWIIAIQSISPSLISPLEIKLCPVLTSPTFVIYFCRLLTSATFEAYLRLLLLAPTYVAYLRRLLFSPTFVAYFCCLLTPPTFDTYLRRLIMSATYVA